MYRIALGETTEDELRKQAQQRGVSPDDLLYSYVLRSIDHTRESRLWEGLRFVASCVVTAAFVVVGFHYLALSLETASTWPTVGRLLHWLRVFVFAFVPWPLTILIGLYIVARSGSAFSLLLGLFGMLRKVKIFGTEIELNEQTKQKIKTAATEIDVAIAGYKKRVDKEVERVAADYQVDHALSTLLDSEVMREFIPDRDKFRCTIHIPDPIEYGRLYQLSG